jgi:hypothetical protein
MPHVRNGSPADLTAQPRDVRFISCSRRQPPARQTRTSHIPMGIASLHPSCIATFHSTQISSKNYSIPSYQEERWSSSRTGCGAIAGTVHSTASSRSSRHRWAMHPGSAPMRDFLQQLQADLPCPVSDAKIFRFVTDPNHPYNSRHPVPRRGALAIVTNVGAGCGGRGSVRRERCSQGGLP